MPDKIARALQALVRGPVHADKRTLTRYATDQSIYRVDPKVVVHPRDLEDVVATVRFARENGLPVTARGAGSGTAGSGLGTGILLAFHARSRDGVPHPMNQILGFEQRDGRPTNSRPAVTVQPGVLHDDLQRFLRQRGHYLPADPSSGAFCVLGGNLATKASGPHALKHGSIDRYLRQVQFVTADGAVVDTSVPTSIPAPLQESLSSLRNDLLADVPSVQRLEARMERKLASGYNLFTLLRHQNPADWVAQLLVGSVGTLGIITRATLRAEPYPQGHATTLLYFRSLCEAGDAVQHIRALDVAAIEIMNHATIKMVAKRRGSLDVPEGEAHMLLVEYEGPERHAQIAATETLIREHGYRLAAPPITVHGAEEQAQLWQVRKAALPTVRNYAGRTAPAIVNDIGVPVAHLAETIQELEALFARLGLVAAIYGHAGSGNLHLRPLFDPHALDLRAQLSRVADEVYTIVLRHDGTITAEHGMGRLRTLYLAREWGPQITGYMWRIKQAFDPQDTLNPDVMFSERALTDEMRQLPTTPADTAPKPTAEAP
jgi:FAD/FMN-containing dehydrogenase